VTFKAATCPCCGGALQAPDDKANIKCIYCGVELTVGESVQLSGGNLKESLRATPVKTTSSSPGYAKVITGCGALALLFDNHRRFKPMRDDICEVNR
jgi:hypothetical protein